MKICVEGWANIAPYHSLLQPIFPLFLLPLQNILKLDYRVHGSSHPLLICLSGVGVTTLASRFEGRGSNPGGDFFIFQKKGEIRTFLKENTDISFKNFLISPFF